MLFFGSVILFDLFHSIIQLLKFNDMFFFNSEEIKRQIALFDCEKSNSMKFNIKSKYKLTGNKSRVS